MLDLEISIEITGETEITQIMLESEITRESQIT